eukprot:6208241-Pleurochrysis_carterae.AAC.2
MTRRVSAVMSRNTKHAHGKADDLEGAQLSSDRLMNRKTNRCTVGRVDKYALEMSNGKHESMSKQACKRGADGWVN